MLGIGEAERQWKVTKRNKGGHRATLSTEKTKKQAAIAAAYSHESQVFVERLTKKPVSCMKTRISTSFTVKVSGRKGRGFPFICSGHGMKAGSPYNSRAQEMIDLQLC